MGKYTRASFYNPKEQMQLSVAGLKAESGKQKKSEQPLPLSLHSVGYKDSNLSPLVCLLNDSLFYR